MRVVLITNYCVRHSWLVQLLAVIMATGCFGDQRFSRAYIEGHPGWTVAPECTSAACYPSADKLISKDIIIRVRPRNYITHYIERDLFVIEVLFPYGETQNIEFDPSTTILELPNKNLFYAKGIPCADVKDEMDRSTFFSDSVVTGYQKVSPGRYCFFLFFDVSPPSVNEMFVLRLQRVKRDGKIIDVPPILFRPGSG